MKKREKRFILFVYICVVIAMVLYSRIQYPFTTVGRYTYNKVRNYAKENNLQMSDYTRDLLNLLERNRETEDFVLSYPMEKDKIHIIDISGEIPRAGVPLFMQWDKRWGYKEYSSQLAALSGCGPVCLSMAAVYTLGDVSLHPAYMIDFAIENDFDTDGSGSLHSLISQGGALLGLEVRQVTADEITGHLEKKNAVIRLMGPGDFTRKGHFIVLTGITEGMITLNDPNSRKNSSQLWQPQEVYAQIRNAWAVIKNR